MSKEMVLKLPTYDSLKSFLGMEKKMPAGTQQKNIRLFFWFLLILLGLRLSLASLIRTSANQVLDRMDHYRGHIDSVGLSFWCHSAPHTDPLSAPIVTHL